MDLRQRMGVDWTALATSVKEMDAQAVQDYIDNALSRSRVHYRVVQRSLEEYCFSQVHTARCSTEQALDGDLLFAVGRRVLCSHAHRNNRYARHVARTY
jgi:hypothetical protein